MNKLLEQAVEKVQALPPETQEQAARLLFAYVGDGEPMFDMTAEEEASFEESFAQADRGEFATDEQVRAIWAKHDL